MFSKASAAGQSWTPPTNLSTTGQDAAKVQLAVAPDGISTVVWTRSDGSNILIQASSALPDIVITSGTPSTPDLGAKYSFQFAATGNPAPTFAVTSGALPTALTRHAERQRRVDTVMVNFALRATCRVGPTMRTSAGR